MNWRDAIIAYIRENAKPVDKFDHQVRLYALTRKIGEGLVYDDDVVFAAAWLHDLGVFIGHRPDNPLQLACWDNVAYACKQVPAILAAFDYPAQKIDGVVEAIRTHQPSGNPTTLEATLVRDADILEQLGAVAVVRSLVKVGRDTRYPTHHEVVPVLEQALAALPDQLHLASSKLLAQQKIEALSMFLNNLKHESQP